MFCSSLSLIILNTACDLVLGCLASKDESGDESLAMIAILSSERLFSVNEFLSLAREISQKFKKSTSGKNHVYVILLDGYAKYRYGLYVGQTSRKVENRFTQHLEGGRLSARCHRKMKILLPSLFEHLNPLSTKEALQIETDLANAFRAVAIRTEGGEKKKRKQD